MNKFILPDGWEGEKFTDNTEEFSWKTNTGIHRVTVDYNKRGFALGSGSVNRSNNKATKKYSGRGWRDRLAADAIVYLEEIMKCPNF